MEEEPDSPLPSLASPMGLPTGGEGQGSPFRPRISGGGTSLLGGGKEGRLRSSKPPEKPVLHSKAGRVDDSGNRRHTGVRLFLQVTGFHHGLHGINKREEETGDKDLAIHCPPFSPTSKALRVSFTTSN